MISGDDLKRIRERLGLTQTQLSEKLGVNRRTLAGWERGDRTLAERGRMIELALAEIERRVMEENK